MPEDQFNIWLPQARFEYCPAKPLVPQEIFDGLDGLKKKLTEYDLHMEELHENFPEHLREDLVPMIADVDDLTNGLEAFNAEDEPIGVV